MRTNAVFKVGLYFEELFDNNVMLLGRYVTIHTTKHKFTTLEQTLINEEFVRVHKSFVIAMTKIQSIEGNAGLINNKRIPKGRTYKLNLMKRIKLN